MGGLGGAEFLILLVIVVLLFGPTLIAFWLGFTLGKKRASEKPATTVAAPRASAPEAPSSAATDTPHEEPDDE